MNFMALLAQAATTAATTAAPAAAPVVQAEKTITQNPSIWSTLFSSDPLIKLTLFILLAFSVACWAIIFFKYKQIRKAQRDSQSFWGLFVQSKAVGDAASSLSHRSGPLYEIYSVGMHLAPNLRKKGALARDYLTQKLAQAREEEIYKLEQYTPFLATTASSAPFIGLFGTVWGILTAFSEIGRAGSTSLATVGPAISEALVATAVGLAAAIPAYISYNYFLHKIKVVIKMMNLFSDDLALRLEEEA